MDVTHSIPAAKVVQMVIYTDRGLLTSQATGTGGDADVQGAFCGVL